MSQTVHIESNEWGPLIKLIRKFFPILTIILNITVKTSNSLTRYLIKKALEN